MSITSEIARVTRAQYLPLVPTPPLPQSAHAAHCPDGGSLRFVDDSDECASVEEGKDPERTQLLFACVLMTLEPIAKDIGFALVKGSLLPQLIGHRIAENIGEDSGRIDPALDPVMVREAADDLPEDPNHPFVPAGVDHVPVDILHLDRHQPFVDVENPPPPVFLGKTRSGFGGPKLLDRIVGLAGE